jgi:glycolate oxidase FAD binding subunit
MNARPVGSGTKLHYGPTDSRPHQSTRHLNKIIEYEPGDLVVGVQAGMRLADLQAELGRHGQWLPLDPPYPDATLGGILATNSSGPRRLAYGTARDLVLGLKVLGPDGVTTQSGGKVVKNVTGFDLPKLHIGAFGSLGMIVEANFKVRPKPEVSRALFFRFEHFEQAHRALLKVHASPLRPAALEVQGPLALIIVEGTQPLVDRHLRELPALLGKQPTDGALQPPRSGVVRLRVGAKPHDLPKLLAGTPASVHVGTGIARIELEDPFSASEWQKRAAAFGGYAVVESAPLEWPERDRLPWTFGPQALQQRVREVFST